MVTSEVLSNEGRIYPIREARGARRVWPVEWVCQWRRHYIRWKRADAHIAMFPGCPLFLSLTTLMASRHLFLLLTLRPCVVHSLPFSRYASGLSPLFPSHAFSFPNYPTPDFPPFPFSRYALGLSPLLPSLATSLALTPFFFFLLIFL